MTMIDFALRRRREWREEGREEGRRAGREEGRVQERRRNIAAIMASPSLTDAEKLQAIAAINGAEDEEREPQSPRRQSE